MTKLISEHGEIAPLVREPKPSWSEVSPLLASAIESHFGNAIRQADIAWGGYTPSPNFRVEFVNGKKVFLKGDYTGNTEWGKRAFMAELANLSGHRILDDFSPALLGHIEVDGWQAMFFELIDDRIAVPPWDNVEVDLLISKVIDLHALNRQEFPRMIHAFDSEFSGPIYSAVEGWADMKTDPPAIDGFCNLFENSSVARKWFDNHIERLAKIERNAKSVSWQFGCIHQDLRSDNILFSRSLGPLFVDWPYFSFGPRAFDLAFLVPSVRGEGGPSPAVVFAKYQAKSGIQFTDDEITTAAVLSAGFFVSGAHQPPLEGLPRVRWVQRLQAFPALNFMCEVLGIKPPQTLPRRSFSEASPSRI
jgi:hypothetical protein